MSPLVDDRLDVAGITRGSLLLRKAYVDVKELMGDAVVAAQQAINAKHHTLRVEFPATPIQLEVDPVRITQVITILLTNAAKHTPNGGLIHLGAHLEPKHLNIYVRDTGLGLSNESISKVFDMFSRVPSQLSRAEGGLGIGLALAKRLIELHGGRVEARSAGSNQGSEFTICLPKSLIVERPALQLKQRGDTDNPTGSRRILIADDNRDSAEAMHMLLKLSGHEVHLAHSGIEALAVATRMRPDVGILDIGMPDLNGYDVAERIRHEPWGKDVTLIAMTGWGQDADKRRALAAGFDHHLTKPIEFETLRQMLGA